MVFLMSLRTRAGWVVALLCVALIGLSVGQWALQRENADRVEAIAQSVMQDAFRNQLNAIRDSMLQLGLQTSEAVRLSPHFGVIQNDAAEMASIDQALQSTQADFVVVLDKEGSLIFGREFEHNTQTARNFSQPKIYIDELSSRTLRAHQASFGVVYIESEPVYLALYPADSGIVVVGSYLRNLLSIIADRTGVTGSTKITGTEHFTVAAVESLLGDALNVGLTNAYPNPYSVKLPPSIWLLFGLMVSFCLAVVVWFSLYQPIVRRIGKLVQQLDFVNLNRDYSTRIEAVGNDEVSHIAHRVNGLLGTLEYAYNLTAKNSKITSDLIDRVDQQNEFKKDHPNSPSEEVRLAFEKVTRLSNAIETGSFELMYQPQYESQSREITGAEALVRWRDENREWVMPQEFLPLVEKSGMMNTLGKWVLLKSCYAAKRWQKRGFKAIPVAVNLNQGQFYDPQLIVNVTEALAAAKLEPKYLELEIQEATIAEHFDWAMEICTNLSTMGVRLTIDDFGAGMLSLRQVTRLPISKLKLDPSFLIQSAAARNVYDVIDGLVGLGDGFGMEVVVKGIETAEQATQLAGGKKHDLQGFLLGKPMEPAELEAALPREDKVRQLYVRRN